jgi:hypothetical protein
MKKKILLFSLVAGMGFIVLKSDSSGPAPSQGNRTGAKGGVTTCSSGGGCHSGTAPAPTMAIRVDSTGGVPVTQYTAGKTYTVTVMGKHASNRKFGFQFATVSGTGSAQVNAGTFAGVTGGIAVHTAAGLNIVEHTGTIAAVSPADSFTKSFTWTAPATGVGTITMYLTVNAVNGNGSDDAGDISANMSKTLTLYTPVSVVNVAPAATIKAFPNPVVNNLNIQVGNAYSNYSVSVYDITGRNIMNTTIDANVTGSASFNTSSWAPGMYQVAVVNGENREVISVVKQ